MSASGAEKEPGLVWVGEHLWAVGDQYVERRLSVLGEEERGKNSREAVVEQGKNPREAVIEKGFGGELEMSFGELLQRERLRRVLAFSWLKEGRCHSNFLRGILGRGLVAVDIEVEVEVEIEIEVEIEVEVEIEDGTEIEIATEIAGQGLVDRLVERPV